MEILLYKLELKEATNLHADYRYIIGVNGTTIDKENGDINFTINLAKVYSNALNETEKEEIVKKLTEFIKVKTNVNIPGSITTKEYLYLGTYPHYISEYKQYVSGNRINYWKTVKDRKAVNTLRGYINGYKKLITIEKDESGIYIS
jgi:DNA polymerase sigma